MSRTGHDPLLQFLATPMTTRPTSIRQIRVSTTLLGVLGCVHAATAAVGPSWLEPAPLPPLLAYVDAEAAQGEAAPAEATSFEAPKSNGHVIPFDGMGSPFTPHRQALPVPDAEPGAHIGLWRTDDDAAGQQLLTSSRSESPSRPARASHPDRDLRTCERAIVQLPVPGPVGLFIGLAMLGVRRARIA